MPAGPTATQIAAVAAEIHLRRGDKVRAVHQDGRHRFRLVIENRKGRTDVVLDVDPTFPRLHLAPAAPARAAPTPLASILRRYLKMARLEGERPVAGDRAVVLVFRRGDETTTLWFEAFGRRATLYLVDGASRVVMTPRGEVAAARGARVGDLFVAVPPATPGRRPTPAADAGAATGVSASRALAAAAGAEAEAHDVARRRAMLLRRLRREAKTARSRFERLQARRQGGAEAARLQHEAELLQASFHLLAAGRHVVRVPDHTTDPPGEVEIRVSASLPPGEQVAAAFRAARKAARSTEEAAKRLPGAQAAVEAADAALREAEAARDPARLDALEAGLAAPARGPASAPARPWREFASADGWRILVGKDARGNDRVTLREARPEDLFLHVRGARGSHVIVPTPRGKTVPKETLLDAAQLAALHSALKDADRAEVEYAPRRHVTKPRKAPPGEVLVQRGKTLVVRREEERRARLRASRRK